MKVFLVACIAAVIIAAGGGLMLNSLQEPVAKAFAAGSARLGG